MTLAAINYTPNNEMGKRRPIEMEMETITG